MLQLICVPRGAFLHTKWLLSGNVSHSVFVVFDDTYYHVLHRLQKVYGEKEDAN